MENRKYFITIVKMSKGQTQARMSGRQKGLANLELSSE